MEGFCVCLFALFYLFFSVKFIIPKGQYHLLLSVSLSNIRDFSWAGDGLGLTTPYLLLRPQHHKQVVAHVTAAECLEVRCEHIFKVLRLGGRQECIIY